MHRGRHFDFGFYIAEFGIEEKNALFLI